MAETTGFTHITVSTDDDDDVVIQAGIARTDDGALGGDADEAGEDGGPVGQAASASAVPAGESVKSEAASKPCASAASDRGRPSDGYRETTLQDIENVKMSSTQKAVIVVALLGIAAFVVWYLFAR